MEHFISPKLYDFICHPNVVLQFYIHIHVPEVRLGKPLKLINAYEFIFSYREMSNHNAGVRVANGSITV